MYLEEDAPAEQLPEDASNRPDVDRVGVVLRAKEDLRGPAGVGYWVTGRQGDRVTG